MPFNNPQPLTRQALNIDFEAWGHGEIWNSHNETWTNGQVAPTIRIKEIHMKNPSVWEAFAGFYDCWLCDNHNNPALIARWGERLSDFETQILCNTEGTPVEGTNRYCDPETGHEWGPMRWPYNSDKEIANYTNPQIKFAPRERVKAIGTTWWDWKNRNTVRLGFDVDSIIGHAPGVGVSQEIIDKISEADVPYLSILKSTRGLGRHLYIEFKNPYPVAMTHHEHAAIARSLIPRLSKDCGVDMEANKDVCGGIMWIWHINATKENEGYVPVKDATDALTADEVPVNWRDHLSVVSGSRATVLVRGWTPDGMTEGDELDQMSQERARIPLDEVHQRILDELEELDYSLFWVDDHHLCQTHTGALLELYDKYLEKGTPLKGHFDTISPSDDPGKPNVFMRPRLNGGWDVYRFGKGTEESPIWDKQGDYTHITYNIEFSLRKTLRMCGGVENPDPKLGFAFNELESLIKALDSLGAKCQLPERAYDGRSSYIRERNDGRVILGISKDRSDKPTDFRNFVKTPKGWECLLDDDLTMSPEDDTQNMTLDDALRALTRRDYDDNTSSGGAFVGWVLKDARGRWVESPRDNIKPYMKALMISDIDTTLGNAVMNSWELVNEPFQPEFPGGRKWNRDAPQFKYQPADIPIDEKPSHPWWDKYYEHLGSDLTRYIKDLDWPKEYGIKTGGDYLKAWVACMFRYPFDKLPYLFMYGDQETGKSMFHETIALLITRGVKSADRALTNDQGYNGELMNAVLAYVDEVDIADAGRSVYNKLKAWTTGLTISIHAKYHQVFEAPNTLHFVQMANHIGSLPVFQGDRRITAFEIPPIMVPIPKDEFMDHMVEEAPHFMTTLMNWDIPEAPSRLRLPVIETESKEAAIQGSEDVLESFITDRCFHVDGQAIKIQDFREMFLSTLTDDERMRWSTHSIKRELIKLHHPVGIAKDNTNWVGNLTFDPAAEPRSKYVVRNKRMLREENL